MKTMTKQGWIGRADLTRLINDEILPLDLIKDQESDFTHPIDLPARSIFVMIAVQEDGDE